VYTYIAPDSLEKHFSSSTNDRISSLALQKRSTDSLLLKLEIWIPEEVKLSKIPFRLLTILHDAVFLGDD
jgi:hypothetical protein